MDIKKAREILETHKASLSLTHVPDLVEALTMALVCMTFVDAIINQWHWLIGKNSEEKP